MDAARILAFRLARSGLAARDARSLADAAACPASDFARDAALLALAARAEDVTREGFTAAVDGGELVLAHIVRGAIHALAPADLGLYGRALLGRDDAEVGPQLGQQVQRICKEHGLSPAAALDEVAAATHDALADRGTLDKVELHAELRERVKTAPLLPWCRSCESHHVAPMLWRFATVKAGARLDTDRRYVLAIEVDDADPLEAVRRFLRFYGPATPGDLADWAGLSRPHAKRLWEALGDELVEVGDAGALLAEDTAALEDPPPAKGVRLLPPGDPYLQKPNRPLLAPDDALRKRLFRPVASPGAVLKDGRLVGLWKAKAKGKRTEITVEKVGRIAKDALTDEAQRVARLRGSTEAVVDVR